ncbi:MAG TPA: L-2-amino-thiazoline-4-carboxylic acid hydrolase [Gemmataceae bacterium]|nr:L-2-amino-thiazoline-4-carboxylic acid hydrolase [Gemmataceae bacterium]
MDVKFHRCPLKQAGLDAGLSEDETATLCRIAARVDGGLFEAAGFSFHADTYKPGGEGCCFLHVRPGK